MYILVIYSHHVRALETRSSTLHLRAKFDRIPGSFPYLGNFLIWKSDENLQVRKLTCAQKFKLRFTQWKGNRKIAFLGSR